MVMGYKQGAGSKLVETREDILGKLHLLFKSGSLRKLVQHDKAASGRIEKNLARPLQFMPKPPHTLIQVSRIRHLIENTFGQNQTRDSRRYIATHLPQ